MRVPISEGGRYKTIAFKTVFHTNRETCKCAKLAGQDAYRSCARSLSEETSGLVC
jgi:hypothetical protein